MPVSCAVTQHQINAVTLIVTQVPFNNNIYSPALEKWGYTGFIIAPLWKSGAILDSPCPSVVPSFREHFVSAQYLKNKLTESDQILYAQTLTRSSLGLLPVIFCKILTELWPLIDVRISFPLNILRTN